MLKSVLALFLIMNIANGCLVADKPYDILNCISINPTLLINLVNNGDLKSFCTTANSYLNCMRTYVEDCIGGRIALGALDELTDLNKKCCISSDTSKCVTKNPSLIKNCFAADNVITLENNLKKSIIDIKVGDIVKAIDSNGNLINSEVVSIMHKNSNEFAQFYNLISSNGKRISLTGGHLIKIKNKGYIKASTAKIGDVMSVYSNEELIDTEIIEIEIETKQGYTAPLTESGTILVNDVHSSCYAEINSHWIADLAMKPIKVWYKLSKYFGMTESETNSDNGLSFYSTVLQRFTENVLPSLFA